MAFCDACNQSVYQRNDDHAKCVGIEPGMYGCYGVDQGAAAATPGQPHDEVCVCEPGRYCPGGATDMVLCPKGTYQNETGQSSCRACGAGTYQPELGSIAPDHACLAIPAGYYGVTVGVVVGVVVGVSVGVAVGIEVGSGDGDDVGVRVAVEIVVEVVVDVVVEVDVVVLVEVVDVEFDFSDRCMHTYKRLS